MADSNAAIPIVSVLMPTHDYARYLPEAVASLRAQTFDDWECIVVDDGSEDETPELLARLAAEDARVRPVRQDQAGPAVARNRALREARGEFVQFLDADDVIPPTKLADHVAELNADAGVDIVYGPSLYFDDDDLDGAPRTAIHDLDAPEPDRVDGAGTDVVAVLLRENVLTIEAPLVRRTVFDELGGFDEQLRRITDWHFWLRCAIAGKRFKFVASEEPVARIRVHGASLSHDWLAMRLVEIEMRRKLSATLPAGGVRDTNEHILAEVRANTGIALGLRGDMLGGLRLLLPVAVPERRRSWLLWSIALLGVPVPAIRRRLNARRYGGL